ncbi:hypothetical protein DB313_05135 (plasmid) [Borrelia turcica IST7]|uniref:Lipoprotein n=1 Tax=Borrelia turcica IST7 TaxID=1104446 RepID=A0A386PMW4_9SPIR|nr:hypothetical protein [Borrelia turcica]AYE36884.1 hypothetical protein DB313_05135 [Borrelia turcica IST7]
MNKINMYTLLLLVSMFVVSCSLLKDSDTEGDVPEVSQVGGDVAKSRDNIEESIDNIKQSMDNIETQGTVQGDEDNNQERDDIQSEASDVDGVGKQVIKLSEEDNSKLKDFVKSTRGYENKLTFIYNVYIAASNNIRTYAVCKDDDTASWCPGWKVQWQSAITKLENKGELVKKFSELEEMIKSYTPKGLTDAISKLNTALEKATATATEKPSTAREAAEAYRSAIKDAIMAYIDSFTSLTSSFSSNKFVAAAKKLAEATKNFADMQNGLYALDAIVYAVSGMVSEGGDISKARKAIQLTGKDKTSEGKALLEAIDALNSVYKVVKP